ncbi:MAG: hypothetical protein ACREDZ_03885 [Kiloniellales bacterium]
MLQAREPAFRPGCYPTLLVILTALFAVAGPGFAPRALAQDEWRDIPTYESDLTLPVLTDLKVVSTSYRNRSNRARENFHLIESDGMWGFFLTSVVIHGFYREGSISWFRKEGRFSEELTDWLKLKPGSLADLKPIEHRSARSSGFTARARNEDSEDCLVAGGAYRFRGASGGDNDRGQFDTIVVGMLCGASAKLQDLEIYMTEVDKVRDRDSFRAALDRR